MMPVVQRDRHIKLPIEEKKDLTFVVNYIILEVT